jgi:hypothetical protein
MQHNAGSVVAHMLLRSSFGDPQGAFGNLGGDAEGGAGPFLCRLLAGKRAKKL